MDAIELRPADWDSYIGQRRVKEELDVAIEASIAENRPLGHVLLNAKPGSGKTCLAKLIADRLGDPFEALSVPSLRPGSLAQFFRRFLGGVVLLDEIHTLSKVGQAQLLTLLWEGYVTSPSGQRINVPFVTVIAATDQKNLLSRALRDRFQLTPQFVDYTDDEMRRMVTMMGLQAGIAFDDVMAAKLARAAAGAPRNAERLVVKARQLQVRDGRLPAAEQVLHLAGIEADGVGDAHLAYMRALDGQGGVAGLETLRMLLDATADELRDVERFLLERRLIVFGDRGRELTTGGTLRVRPASDGMPLRVRQPA